MFYYRTFFINIISIIISVIIFFSISFIRKDKNYFIRSDFKVGFETEMENTIKSEKSQENLDAKVENKILTKEVEQIWKIEIPCIGLEAEIKEGTTKEIMENFVGHFEETKRSSGNIGLAAHNRGYTKNYFENIKKLKKGDKIYYKYKENKKMFEVIENCIIKDTDWSYLENTIENKITLITCVENEPQYRRCVQAIERESEE